MDERSASSPRMAMDEAFLMSTQLSELMERGVKALGLTSLRARMLHAILQLGPMRQRQISDVLGCSTQQVAAVLDVLSDRGLIERRPDPNDRRAHLVTLTETGGALADQLESHRAAVAEWLLKDLPPEKLDAFMLVAQEIRRRAVAPPSM
ncbi:MarR family winged helix-turn-helix transcriptional regulator [Rhodococcus spongiicola]|uniref:MarR family transcriptional regulator n=1 Tax=Rhodococcus spongiicola TaxID=2487352 RepID=A0A3S3ZNB6_9NOCA|nr:MarR family transcriptional regulator [Rhodococcus spongiicola]RVW04596.1 MarR family transcriptional regulator [Rhodococcus spongiicola]